MRPTTTARLAAGIQRDWPQEWSAHEDETIGDFSGWCHRYRFDPPLTEDQVASFESAHNITLPAGYRQFLTELGNGGAGPGFGVYRLGEGEADPLPDEVLQAISADFSLSEAWNDTSLIDSPERYHAYDLMAGAVPIADDGDGMEYWLVISGSQAGQIWLDKRSDGEGGAPVSRDTGETIHFAEWYEEWLDAAYRQFAGE